MKHSTQYLVGTLSIFLCALAVSVPAQTNVALSKTATASSIGGAGGPELALDGDIQTRWETSEGTVQELDESWFLVDLGSVYDNINCVIIKWEFAFGRTYEIQVSTDNVNWTTAKNVDWARPFNESSVAGVNWNQQWNSWLLVGTDSLYFDPVAARYVRFQGKRRATPYGYSFWEFEVYDNAPVPAEIPTHDYPDFTEGFTVKGGHNPCEIINVGPVEYGPFMFHTNAGLINRDGGYSDLIFPGGTKIQWTYKWNMYNIGYIPINNMAGIWYGRSKSTWQDEKQIVRGGAPTQDIGILPLPITADIYTKWVCDYSSESGSYTVAYDMWLDDGTEVMIFLNKTGRYAYRSTSWKRVTLGGIEWDVSGTGVKNADGFATFSFDPVNRPIKSVDINLKDFYKVLTDPGYLSTERKLLGMWVGTETGGSGTADRTRGQLTTTEFTISSPDAPVSVWNPIEKAAPAVTQNGQTSESRIMLRLGSDGAASRLGRGNRYTVRGEKIGTDAVRKSKAGIVVIEKR